MHVAQLHNQVVGLINNGFKGARFAMVIGARARGEGEDLWVVFKCFEFAI